MIDKQISLHFLVLYFPISKDEQDNRTLEEKFIAKQWYWRYSSCSISQLQGYLQWSVVGINQHFSLIIWLSSQHAWLYIKTRSGENSCFYELPYNQANTRLRSKGKTRTTILILRKNLWPKENHDWQINFLWATSKTKKKTTYTSNSRRISITESQIKRKLGKV